MKLGCKILWFYVVRKKEPKVIATELQISQATVSRVLAIFRRETCKTNTGIE